MKRIALCGLYCLGFVSLVCACDLSGGADTKDDPPSSESVSQLSLGSVLGHNVTSGSTCGLLNGVTPTCAISTASDMAYEWVAPSSGTFTFTTTGASTNYNTVLQLASFTAPGTVLGCNNDASASTTKSTVALTLSANTKILVQIDGYASLCGTYQLGITKNCTSGCSSPPPCHESLGCNINGTCNYQSMCGPDEVCSSNECIPRCTLDPRFPC